MSIFSVHKHRLPSKSLLIRYCPERLNTNKTGYCDCYAVTVSGTVELKEYIYHFYSTWIFKLERRFLRFAVNLPSTDHQVQMLAEAKTDKFAAWSVEKRQWDQLLLCDFSGRTRSWLMRADLIESQVKKTQLLFGSAVLPITDPNSGNPKLGILFTALLGFHKLYSRLLLAAARNKIAKSQRRISA